MGNSSSTGETATTTGTSKKFLNGDGARAVEEMLEGMVRMHAAQLRLLRSCNVVVRADFEQCKSSQVALISGGGSGHEPAHAGLCGPGLLTAAVCGHVFASPSVESVLTAIRTVTGPRGCLLIVKNYTGDRLNFGLAAEQAKADGLDVEMVIVGDDAALEAGKGVTGRRGLAGTVLVHKIAGAAAAEGADLRGVTAAAEAAAAGVRTMGVALTVCNVPGAPLSDRLSAADGLMEVGLGIHGEPGRAVMPLASTDAIVSALCEKLLDDFKAGAGVRPRRVAVIVNNLGGTTALELYGICAAVLRLLEGSSVTVERIFAGPLMTSLEMQGMSLSMLALDAPAQPVLDAKSMLELLDAPASAVGWPGAFSSFSPDASFDKCCADPAPAPDAGAEPAQDHPDALRLDAAAAARLERQLRAGAQALLAQEEELTRLDKVCGDGDAGNTFAKGARLVLAAIDAGGVPCERPHRVLAALSEQARRMGGSSGAVLAIFFAACEAQMLRHAPFAAAFQAGCAAVTRYGGAERGMRTMLDAMAAVGDGLQAGEGVEELAARAEDAARATAEMAGAAGRSNYVPDEKLRGVADPGAMAVAYAMRAAAQA